MSSSNFKKMERWIVIQESVSPKYDTRKSRHEEKEKALDSIPDGAEKVEPNMMSGYDVSIRFFDGYYYYGITKVTNQI